MPTANSSSAADAPQPGTLKDDADGTQKDDADETCDPDALLNPDRVASSPLPGVVLLKNALDEAGQREVLEWALRHGIDLIYHASFVDEEALEGRDDLVVEHQRLADADLGSTRARRWPTF